MGEYEGSKAAIEEALRLDTRVVLAETRLSPLELAEARRRGTLELTAPAGDRVLLEVGGLAIAEGRLVKKGGAWRFKVERLFAEGEGRVGA